MPRAHSTAPAAALEPGRAAPLGATPRDGGVNFAVASEHADRIELCVFDAEGRRELWRLPLHGPDDGVFHGFLAGAGPGLLYGLRAHGRHAPHQGERFNPHKLLLDPYAREIVGRFEWGPEHHGHVLGHPEGTHSLDDTDNAATALKARVSAPRGRAPARLNAPRHATRDLVLYEVHVKGFTQRLAAVPEALRGTYAGLAHPAAVAHLKALGVTTLSLLPVHYTLDEEHLARRGAVNYWGYNTLGFFCPEPRLAAAKNDPAAVIDEFRAMVHTLHAQGLEVVLDVVYNHTAEAGEQGPTISFRGLDNATWYRLNPHDPARCENWTGCGNTVNASQPRVAQLVLDSLRFWFEEMGVDGFRFDLAPILGRSAGGAFDPQAAFFVALRQDPVLADVHLIAEPWDAALGGYQLGRFPGRFLEWNDRFRDAVRGWWLGRPVGRGEFVRRFAASSDLFHLGRRRPTASVNFVTAHDGYTLADCVSYAHKHNHANGEGNRDGRDDELCGNFGIEGPTESAAVLQRRERARRAMLATLLLAQGTPMLAAGDEIGRTQHGNNNAYCQDSALSWLDWDAADAELCAWVARVLQLRREEPVLRHDDWFAADGEARNPATPHIAWLAPGGTRLAGADWVDTTARAFACLLDGGSAVVPARPPLWIAFNAGAETLRFVLPIGAWRLVIDSSGTLTEGTPCRGDLPVPACSVLVLRAQPGMAA